MLFPRGQANLPVLFSHQLLRLAPKQEAVNTNIPKSLVWHDRNWTPGLPLYRWGSANRLANASVLLHLLCYCFNEKFEFYFIGNFLYSLIICVFAFIAGIFLEKIKEIDIKSINFVSNAAKNFNFLKTTWN